MTAYFFMVEYSADDLTPLVSVLVDSPELIPVYQESMIGAIEGVMSWGDYRSAIEGFSVMCRVLAAVRQARGEDVLV